jgi:hypothetical protein
MIEPKSSHAPGSGVTAVVVSPGGIIGVIVPPLMVQPVLMVLESSVTAAVSEITFPHASIAPVCIAT